MPSLSDEHEPEIYESTIERVATITADVAFRRAHQWGERAGLGEPPASLRADIHKSLRAALQTLPCELILEFAKKSDSEILSGYDEALNGGFARVGRYEQLLERLLRVGVGLDHVRVCARCKRQTLRAVQRLPVAQLEACESASDEQLARMFPLFREVVGLAVALEVALE